MEKVAKITAEYLLQIKAIKLQPTNPFTWASGWKSPIYCDNRKTLSYPDVRTFIKNQLTSLILHKYSDVEVIAGVATGAIAQGALVAQEIGAPFVYVRSSSKGHGLENQVEGRVKAGQKTVVIEDLISTGNSSLKAVEALRDAGCKVLGMVAIFSYCFPIAEKNFNEAGCELTTLSNYNELIDLAIETGYITREHLETLKKWREDPGAWPTTTGVLDGTL
ncbi:MAG: orotate phosphoribosyltransferase [Bacteroidetes bacterium]|nr:orotate phosphoribosyltransferase [Bacteroidota bacterium]